MFFVVYFFSASALLKIRVLLWKQILPGYLANLLYLLESNVRNAAVLGFVGAGGIGLLLNEKLAWREYSKVGTILCVLYLVVLATESLSGFLRVRLIESETKHKKWYVPAADLLYPANKIFLACFT